MNKNMLIITYDMIPYSTTWGGAQRMYYLANYLQNFGWNVTVISCKKNKYNDYGKDIKFKNVSIPIKHIIWRKAIRPDSNNATKSYSEKYSKLSSFLRSNNFFTRVIHKFDELLYNEPNFLSGPVSRIWVKENVDEIRKIIKEKDIKVIIVSGPPFGMFNIINSINNLKILKVLDYRDPFNLWNKPRVLPFLFEKRVIKKANLLTFTNEALMNDMIDRFKLKTSQTLVVANGYDDELWSRLVSTKARKINITYIGSISIVNDQRSIRNLSEFIDAMKELVRDNYDIHFDIYGADNIDQKYFNHLVQDIKSRVSVHGSVPTSAAIQIMSESAILLLLHTSSDNSSKYIISGKLYDYIAAKKPILSIGNYQSQHKTIIEKNKIGLHVENNCKLIKNAIIEIISNIDSFNSNIDVKEYSRNAQYNKLLNKVEEIEL